MTARRPARTIPVMALAALTLLAAACAGPAPIRWQKPGAGAADWDRDEGLCRARARALVEREFRERGSEVGSPMSGSGQTLAKQMAVYDARRQERRQFEDCLRANGYTPEKGAEN